MKKHALFLSLIFTTARGMQQQEITFTAEKIATFKAIQKIFECAKETAEELKDTCELTLPEMLQLDPTCGQTQQGLRLIVRSYPRFIETPWGLLTLFMSAAHHNPHCFDAPKETLFKKIGCPDKTCQEKLSSWPYKNNKDAELIDTSITRRNLELDLDRIILNKLQRRIEYLEEIPGEAYAIDTVHNEKCPPVLILSKGLYRSPQTIMSEWQTLQELAQNNYVSITPQLTKSQKTTRKTPTCTPPSLSVLPTGDPSDPTSPTSPVLAQPETTCQVAKPFHSPGNYGSFNLVSSPGQSPSPTTKPCSPEEQEYSKLLPLSETHTPDANCTCRCSLM